MKNFFSAILLTLCLSTYSYSQTALDAILQGTIKNITSATIELRFYNNPIDEIPQSISIDINDKGQFYSTFPLKRALDAQLICGNERVNIYIEPEERVEVYSDAKNFSDSIKFSGTYFNNQYKIDYNKLFSETRLNIERNKHILQDSPEVYKKYEDSVCKAKLYFIEEYNFRNKLSRTFMRRQKATYRYGANNYKYQYISNFNYLANKSMTVDSSYYSFMSELSVRENDLLTVNEFYKYLDNYYSYRYNEEKPSVNTEAELVSFEYNLAQSIYEDRIKNIFLTKKFAEILASHPYEITKKYISDYMSNIINAEFRAYIDNKILQAMKGSTSSMAYDFMLQDNKGKWVKLSDFKGEAVYLNFWASWCKPCMEEIENHNFIDNQYKDYKLKTVMISVDENATSWKKAIMKYNKNIIQLRTGGMKTEIIEKYNVKNIPKSILINKDGVIIHSDMPSPSNAEIYKYITAEKK